MDGPDGWERTRSTDERTGVTVCVCEREREGERECVLLHEHREFVQLIPRGLPCL